MIRPALLKSRVWIFMARGPYCDPDKSVLAVSVAEADTSGRERYSASGWRLRVTLKEAPADGRSSRQRKDRLAASTTGQTPGFSQGRDPRANAASGLRRTL